MAATKGQLAAVKYLTEKGADVNYVHPLTKMTAFHLAAYDGYEEVVKYLAAHGADINKKMRGDVDIIRIVRDTGNTKMVELLKSLGVREDGCLGECL
jgi:ankyrin repeat protein